MPQRRGRRGARAWANQALGHAEYSPNYQRLLEHGDATDVGDLLAAGDESAVVERLRSFRDAGVTDLAVRVLPLGPDRDARIESRRPHARVPLVAVSRALSPDAPSGRSQASACSRSATSSPARTATMLLADLGADVIKIEPVEGDLSRQVGSQLVDEHNVYFASINRNKRSVHIDLTTAEGQARARRARADGARAARQPAPVDDQELGLDYESLRRFNPKIVCVALTGYGLDGPRRSGPRSTTSSRPGSASPR